MDKIETLSSDNQLWFQDEINKLANDFYTIISCNTHVIEINGEIKIIWTALLSNPRKGR